MLWRPRFDACRFISCDWSGSIVRYAAFCDCIFERTALNGSIGGGTFKTIFSGCTFKECMWGEGFGPLRTSFVNCQFLDMKLDNIVFRDCALENCVFTGTFKDVRWIRCSTKNVDVSKVKMTNAMLFVASKEYDIKLPDNDENFLAFREDFRAAQEAVKGSVSGGAYADYRGRGRFDQEVHGEIVDFHGFMHLGRTSEVEAQIITACLREAVLARRGRAGESSEQQIL